MNPAGSSSCHSFSPRFTSPFLPKPSQIAELQNILRSNSLPPELSSIQTTISATPTELERYDWAINSVKTELNRLSSERRTLASYTDGCRSALSPIRRVSVEVLVEIFDLCVPEGRYQLSEDTTPEVEVDRLSGRYLLQLAQASSDALLFFLAQFE
jgi:hypothetical protein